MYYDWTIVLVIPAMLFAMIASWKVKSTFRKYSEVRTMSGLTGAQAARTLLDRNGLNHIRVETIAGELTASSASQNRSTAGLRSRRWGWPVTRQATPFSTPRITPPCASETLSFR